MLSESKDGKIISDHIKDVYYGQCISSTTDHLLRSPNSSLFLFLLKVTPPLDPDYDHDFEHEDVRPKGRIAQLKAEEEGLPSVKVAASSQKG